MNVSIRVNQSCVSCFVFRLTRPSFQSGGGYRNVFLVEEHDRNPNLVFKVAQIDLDYKVQDFEFMRMEGGVNAAITPHPRVVSMYGFCALSMFSEALMRGNVEGFAMP